MPQMAPYNWMYLFLMFNMIMIYINSHIHFTNLNKKNLFKSKSFNLHYYKWNW